VVRELDAAGGVRHRLVLELEPGLAGTNLLPAAEARLAVPDGEETVLRSEPMPVRVFSVLDVPPWEAKPEPMIEEPPVESSSTLVWLGIAFLLALLGVGWWRFGRSRPAEAAREPGELARRRLLELLEDRRNRPPDPDHLARLLRTAGGTGPGSAMAERLDLLRFSSKDPASSLGELMDELYAWLNREGT
jgi:hypothetical protein